MDASAFAHSTASLLQDLERRGYKGNAKWVRDPVTGERYPHKVEIGIAKYNRLNKLPSQKIRYRTRGKVDRVTGQPVAGRGAGEAALRMGVMETTALAAHGGSATLDDACRGRSDGTRIHVCGKCGNSHLLGNSKPCPACGGAPVEIETTTASVRMHQVCEAMGVGFDIFT